MNELQKEILAVALKWLYKKQAGVTWEEKGANRGDTLKELRMAYGGISLTKAEAWCALFSWVVINEACQKVGAINILPKNLSAIGLLNASRKVNNLIVKKDPDVGAVFYRKSQDPDSSGHIGVVVKITDKAIYTIEGNADDKVAMLSYPLSIVEAPSWKFNFIWTGRFPYNGKSSVSEKEVTLKIDDTANTEYYIARRGFETVSTTNKKKKKNRKRKEFR
jgi:hypothetical protein